MIGVHPAGTTLSGLALPFQIKLSLHSVGSQYMGGGGSPESRINHEQEQEYPSGHGRSWAAHLCVIAPHVMLIS